MRTALIAAFVGISSITAAALPSVAHAYYCSEAPQAPKGHVLGKVESIKDGIATIRFAANLDKKHMPKVGDDMHVMRCNGTRFPSSDTKILSVQGNVATARVAGDPKFMNESYVAIDSGYESKAPPESSVPGPKGPTVTGAITDVQRHPDGARITFAGGEEYGVFVGARGWLLDKNGKRTRNTFVVTRSSREAATGIIEVEADQIDGANSVMVERGTPRCFAPKPLDAAGVAKLRSGATPPGFIIVNLDPNRTAWPKVTISKGASDNVATGNAWLLGATDAPLPVVVQSVSARQANIVIAVDAGGVHRAKTGLKVAVPVTPETAPNGVKCQR